MNNKIINSNEYIIITIYIDNIVNEIFKIAYLIIKVHIIKNLKINIFINMNIITL